jgi:hypothetical protein
VALPCENDTYALLYENLKGHTLKPIFRHEQLCRSDAL